jgi:site-specific DNA-methyltransferase (adenine-specific)
LCAGGALDRPGGGRLDGGAVSVSILIGDCRERMAELDAASIDSCVCDPPYHLTSIVKRFGAANAAPAKVGKTGAYARASRGFMGQTWDGGDVAFQPETWAEVLRVLKPGSHLVAFSGTRTYHRMACAIEDAGFEIRDQLAWVYGSGFPKSHNQPGGWGTALKPAWEPICLARKPLVGTVAANVQAHGTGCLNIDGCRVEGADNKTFDRAAGDRSREQYRTGTTIGAAKPTDLGRWPANIIHDGSEEVLAAFPDAPGQSGTVTGNEPSSPFARVYGDMPNRAGSAVPRGDSGSAARFFYAAKATTEERGEGNNHPTVKPINLMRWLCRLVTPIGGTILDPFAGSGSTLIAADAEQFHAIGCELSPDYAAIAERRVRDAAGMFAEVRAA